ncbi:MAG: hypothetical protein HYZ27_04850, partial [Deltaproteobacteria bacterium]|nr:hypothetical protein [Deltaproteobacteria bacterium]
MTFVQKRLVGLGVLVLAAGLGALAIYGQQEKLRQDDAEKKVEEKVLRVASANDIAQVALQSAKGRFVMARQDSGGWRLVEPIATAADEVTANALARYLAELRRTRLVGEPRPEGGATPPPDTGICGLSPPRFG